MVLGESGSGKTTMLRMINRLTAPTAGTVKVGAVDVQALDPLRSRDDARRYGSIGPLVKMRRIATAAEFCHRPECGR